MLKNGLLLSIAFAACAPTTRNTTPVYVGNAPAAAPAAPRRGIAIRGKVPRGQRVDRIVAVQIDNQGKRRKIHVRPSPDGSYQLQLPPGHQYAMAYEERGRIVGNVSFPSSHGQAPSQVINVSQNVVVNQQYVDLGEPTYVGGFYVAAADPEIYLDSDGDGMVDAQDPDDAYDDQAVAIDATAWQGDLEDIDESATYEQPASGYEQPAEGYEADDDGTD